VKSFQLIKLFNGQLSHMQAAETLNVSLASSNIIYYMVSFLVFVGSVSVSQGNIDEPSTIPIPKP
jgi:hypothetical protein